jgi:hypothetical protein
MMKWTFFTVTYFVRKIQDCNDTITASRWQNDFSQDVSVTGHAVTKI